jgi:K(+)-stimulated pyrophosphate-energized sodium pump
VALTEAAILAGLVLGAMMPYIFSSFTIQFVGKAAIRMVDEVRR